jgi:hypothetical protein
MAVAFTIVLLAAIVFASLYSKCRENVLDLRERLEDAYEQRDDAVVAQQAAEAKAEHLAGVVKALSDDTDIPASDAFLLGIEADLDGELHGLAAILSANDIAEEQA